MPMKQAYRGRLAEQSKAAAAFFRFLYVKQALAAMRKDLLFKSRKMCYTTAILYIFMRGKQL